MANETGGNAADTTFTLLSHGEIADALAATADAPPAWPSVDDRAAWERLAASPHGAAMRRAVMAAAHEEAKTPGVRLPSLTEFLAFRRTGDRRTWEGVADRTRVRAETFAMALCFTGEPVWADRTADALWSLCEMTGWVTPAHEHMPIPDPQSPTVDLWSAMTAQEVAEALQIVAPALDRIDPRIARHVRREVERRVLDPFLARGDWWWLWQQPAPSSRLNNWTAVCSGAVLCAALALPGLDPDRQAHVVRKAAWSLQFFRDTFESEGSLDEGVGYWSYGFSYYVMAAERLAARTGGRMDLLADPVWKKVAAFPLGVRLYGDTFVNFSDCAPVVRPAPGWVAWLGEKTGESGLAAWAKRLAAGEAAGFGTHHRYLPFSLRTLTWTPASGPEAPAPVPSLPSLVSYLPDVEWLVARSDASDDALILAVKGGHNAESHNHNDGGSILVHYRREALVAELGAPTYTRQFFGAERYENVAARSLGHSVPYVNGCEQAEGRAHAAEVLAREGASVALELAGLYPPEAGLESLTRTASLTAGDGGPKITLSDEARFTADGATFALPLITLDAAPAVTGPGSARIAGARGAALDIAWDPARAACRVEEVPTDDPKFCDAEGGTRIRRLWFDATVVGRAARLDLTLTPGE